MATKKTNEEEKETKVVKKTTTKKKEEETKKEQKPENTETISGLTVKGEIVLIYLIQIVGFIFAIMKSKKVSSKLRFHYNQAGTIWLVNIICNIGMRFLGGVVPFSGLISYAIAVILFIFTIIALVKAYSNDEEYKIPVIYDLSVAIFGEPKED